MRWFKHMTDMLDDEWVQDFLLEEFGISGYGMWCGVLELYARHCGDQPGDFCRIPVKTFTRKLHVSAAKVERLLNSCATSGKLSFIKVDSFFDIRIPKMQSFRDEWSRKKNQNSGATPEPLRNKTTEDRIKKKEEKTTTPISPTEKKREGSGGLFFEIENRGQRMTEDEWIYRNILEHRRNKGWKSEGAYDLQSLLTLYPNHMEQFRRWASQPMARRIAAYAYGAIKVAPDNHFKYALKMAQDGEGDEFMQYVYAAQKQVDQKDYMVRIDG